MSVRDYALPVHRSIIKRELYLGIPLIPLVIIGFVSVLLVFGFGQLGFLVISVVLWLIMKIITTADEWLIDMVLSSLLQPDRLG